MNKIALITGATSGIGRATALLFAKNDFDIIITGRRMERLQKLSKEIQEDYKIAVLVLNFDVRDNKEVSKNLADLPAKWKNIDVLINNAGLAVGAETIDKGELEDWERMIDTNIKGLLYVSKIIMPLMIKRNKGHIINLGSIAGKEVYLNGNVYCATKHAVDALSKAMRIDLLPHNIKVTNIAPGMIETEFSIVRYKGDKNKADSVYNNMEPLKAEDIAEVILFAAQRPPHVTLNDIVIMPTAQANTSHTVRNL
jgi:NADP-dependent 3-hydroxy acid dehydrogenase YdfG